MRRPGRRQPAERRAADYLRIYEPSNEPPVLYPATVLTAAPDRLEVVVPEFAEFTNEVRTVYLEVGVDRHPTAIRAVSVYNPGDP